MKRVVLGCVASGLVLAGAMLLHAMPGAAGEGDDPPGSLPPQPNASESNAFEKVETSALRQRYLEILRKRSELMSEEELQQAIGESQRVLDEDLAAKALQEAVADCVRALDAIVESHPNTRAAQRSKVYRSFITTAPPDSVLGAVGTEPNPFGVGVIRFQ